MVATLPASLATNHEPSGIELSQILTAITRMTNIQLFWATGCSLSTTSTSYTNVQGAVLPFNKLGDATDSDVLLIAGASAFVAAQPNIISYTISDGANTHDTHFMYYNVAAHHDWSWGLVRVPLLTPNVYNFQLQANVTGGTTATIQGSGDSVFMLAAEIPL